MASLRRVRKSFRKEALQLIEAGDGNIENLIKLAEQHFGNDVGYLVALKSFLQSEVSNAVSTLRNDGRIETIGKKWKPADQLETDDVSIISIRRLKRLRGELMAEIRLAHNHGMIDEATAASQLLAKVEEMLGDDGDRVATGETVPSA